MNLKLAAIGAKAAEDLKAYMKEHEEKILEAQYNATQEAQDNEEKLKFKLGFSITLDLEKDTMETALTWGCRFKASSTANIPDPDQADLPLEDTITLKVPAKEAVTVTGKQFTQAVNKVKGMRHEDPHNQA